MSERETAIKLAQDFASACAQFVPVRKAILFGSYASGNFNSDSDIDVAIISDDFSNYPIADLKKIVKAVVRYAPVEPHTYSTKYFEKGDPFVEEIKRTGIEIAIL